MTVINTLIPFLSAIISFIFAFVIFKRYYAKRRPHLLLWGLGMVFYGIGGFCEGYFGAFGWNPLIFRMWYLFGAILVAAWLGQGTVYLLAKRRIANILMLILGVASAYAAIRIFSAELDPSLLTTSVHTGSLFSLDFLSQASLATPCHWEYLDCSGRASAGIRRCIQPLWNIWRPLHR